MLLKFIIVSAVFIHCSCFKVYFEHEDVWEEENEVFSDEKYQRFQLIFPGTKWCGTGNVASDYNDLGANKETDMCCREHDLCDDVIETNDSKYNLTNNAFYTRLNCKCDDTFYKCLIKSKLKSSRAIGHIYFNALGTQCYRYSAPITGCKRYHSIVKTRCVEYTFNENGEKRWQWFNVPEF